MISVMDLYVIYAIGIAAADIYMRFWWIGCAAVRVDCVFDLRSPLVPIAHSMLGINIAITHI